jgi:hypothetical protein
MPAPSAERRFARYLIQLPLLHRPLAPASAGAGLGWTRNLSEGGACVELAERVWAGIPLRLRLHTDRGAIEVEGQVVWTGDPGPAGGVIPHGVAFTPVGPDQLAALQELLRSKGEVRHAGVRLPLELAVTCRPKGHDGAPLQGRTGDIGRGGLLLRLPQAVPPGTALEVTLHAPSEPLGLEGAVAWAEPPEKRRPGELIQHGLRFTALGRPISLFLGHILAKPLPDPMAFPAPREGAPPG